jgi:hypothetical protein
VLRGWAEATVARGAAYLQPPSAPRPQHERGGGGAGVASAARRDAGCSGWLAGPRIIGPTIMPRNSGRRGQGGGGQNRQNRNPFGNGGGGGGGGAGKTCHQCGQVGHLKRDCPNQPAGGAFGDGGGGGGRGGGQGTQAELLKDIKIDWSDPSKSVPTASYPNKWPVSCYGPNIKVRTPAGGGGGSSVTTRGGPCLLTGDVSPEELAMAWCKAKTDPGACTVVPI